MNMLKHLILMMWIVMFPLWPASSFAEEILPLPVSEYSIIDGVYFYEHILVYYPPENSGSIYFVPEGTIGITSDAFRDAIHLEYIHIPSSCRYIGVEKKANECTRAYLSMPEAGQFQGYYVESTNDWFTSIDGVLFSKDTTTLYQFPNNSMLNSYSIPEGVTTIAPYAFMSTNLQFVSLPKSLVCIGEKAFYHASIRGITLPSQLRVIAREAFAASNLDYVHLPDGLRVIADSAFEGCNLTCVTLPSSLEYLGTFAFFGNPVDEGSIVELPESLKYIGDDIFLFGVSSWEVWTPTYGVTPDTVGHTWADKNGYPYFFIDK